MGLRRLLVKMLDPESGSVDDVVKVGPSGKFIIGPIAPSTPETIFVPMTTTVGGGDPQLVFTPQGELFLMEVYR